MFRRIRVKPIPTTILCSYQIGPQAYMILKVLKGAHNSGRIRYLNGVDNHLRKFKPLNLDGAKGYP